MCEIRYVKERIRTWQIILGMDAMDLKPSTKRLRQLDRRLDRLVNDYNTVLEGLQEEHANARIPVDSNAG